MSFSLAGKGENCVRTRAPGTTRSSIHRFRPRRFLRWRPIGASHSQPGLARAALPRRDGTALGAAALGGIVGASLRWGVAQPFDLDPEEFPWDDLIVNVVGCLLIGIAAARMVRGSIGWTFAVTGVLGGFTTMSGFALGFNDLVIADRTGLAITYFVVTMTGGVLGVLAGRTVSR